jgi:hypothetical protein
MVCPKCEAQDKADPRYEEARDAEIAAVKQGNYNFKGIRR